jgi:Tfp pilus assembly protein PilV
MPTDKTKLSPGYVLFDVLLALFLFSLGFAVLFGLTEGAVSEARQASSLMEGTNLAQKKLEELSAHAWADNIAQQACIPGGTVEGNEGKFHWKIVSNWDDIPQLLRVSVEVRWTERRNPAVYKLESLYAVE